MQEMVDMMEMEDIVVDLAVILQVDKEQTAKEQQLELLVRLLVLFMLVAEAAE